MAAKNPHSVGRLQSASHRLSIIKKDLDPLIDLAGDAVFRRTYPAGV